MIRHRLILYYVFFILLPVHATAASSEIQSARALEIQAAFLIKFSSYVKWPDDAFSGPEDPIIVGIVGRDPFGSSVDKIARSMKANGRNVEVRRYINPASLTKCHILFVPSSEKENMPEIKAAMSRYFVLLVGNFPGFLEQTGIINFVMVGNKIRFNISKRNYRKAGLSISSKLLSVAHEVKE